MNDKKPSSKSDLELFLEEIDSLTEEKISQNKSEEPHKTTPQRKNKYNLTIDLHGLRVKEAKEEIVTKLANFSNIIVELKVITGKGIHSEGGAVLAEEIYLFVKKHFKDSIKKIDAAPNHATLRGAAIRGHFDVTLNL